MRASPMTFCIVAALAAVLLSACTVDPSTASPPQVTVSSTPAVTAPLVTPPLVTPPLVTVPPIAAPSTVPTSTLAPTPTSPGTSTSSTTAPPPVRVPPATYRASPRLGSTDLSPRTPITVHSVRGTLAGLTLRNAAGTAVRADMTADRRSWTVREPLGYGATYTLAGRAVGADGRTVPIQGTYTTVEPADLIGTSISPDDGDTVGIAAPIMFSIGTDIDDTVGRQNIEKAITVTTVPKTAGSLAWIRHWNGWGLDWRPKAYWLPGTKVTVTANLYGVSYGNGLWGKQDLTSSFTIGRSEITKADINSHRLKVYRDGKLLFDFPTSYGLESDPGRVTHGGTYIVMSKEYLHLMSNPAYHYVNFKAYYAVRISNNGTFIHANDDTADVQGYRNVTHGCANLTMTNARLFYEQTMYGDPVEVTGSSIPMSASDGDVYDWSIPWAKWQTLSALSTAYIG